MQTQYEVVVLMLENGKDEWTSKWLALQELFLAHMNVWSD
jgi:hypothetical protein